MSADIQQARDVLAKWREQSAPASPQPWAFIDNGKYRDDDVHDAQGYPIRDDGDFAASAGGMDSATARLIVGTAGNPELLDAIDEWLADAQQSLAELEASDSHAIATLMRYTGGGRHKHALKVAAAILAAEDRMSA